MSRVGLVCIVAVVSLSALWVLFQPEFVRGPFQSSPDSVHHKEVSKAGATVASKAAAPAALASLTSPFSSRRANSEAIEPQKLDAQMPTATSLQQKGMQPFDVGHDQANVTAPQPEGTDPSSVIGRPFPVSASIRDLCKNENCPHLDEYQSKFTQEPRDPSWSNTMEAQLRDYVNSQPGSFTIRNIECRTSLCFVEVASNYGQLRFAPAEAFNDRVFEVDGEFGFERGPSSGKITITLNIYQRWK